MRHALGGGFDVAGQAVPADVDARRQHQPVIGQPAGVADDHRAGVGIDASRRLEGDLDGAFELLVVELLRLEIAQSGDDVVAERAGGEGVAGLDQRHRDARIDVLERAGAGRAGESAAHDDDAAAGALRDRGRGQADGRGACGGALEEIASVHMKVCHDGQSFCAAYQAAMALISSSVKPLAIRSMTVAARCPLRNSCIAVTMSAGLRPASRVNGVSTARLAGWQPEQAAAPAGATSMADAALADTQSAINACKTIDASHDFLPNAKSHGCLTQPHALLRSWFFKGSERMRLPVAAKMALHNAGATTATGGSPQPPQNPPDGISTVSTLGISARRSIR